jgi:membrane protease YdiL (CAAX protease family)
LDLPIGAGLGWALHWIVAALYWVIERLGADLDVDGPARSIADRAVGFWPRLGLVLLVVVGAPLFEEFFYRGCVQRRLVAAFGPAAALLGSSALFAVAHLQLVQFPGLLLVGLGLGGVNLYTGRAGSNTVGHAVFNLLTVLTLLGVSVPGLS